MSDLHIILEQIMYGTMSLEDGLTEAATLGALRERRRWEAEGLEPRGLHGSGSIADALEYAPDPDELDFQMF